MRSTLLLHHLGRPPMVVKTIDFLIFTFAVVGNGYIIYISL